MEVMQGRNNQQIAEDGILEAIVLTEKYHKASASLRARTRFCHFEYSLEDYKRWEGKLTALVDCCEETSAWRMRVNNTLREWRFVITRMD